MKKKIIIGLILMITIAGVIYLFTKKSLPDKVRGMKWYAADGTSANAYLEGVTKDGIISHKNNPAWVGKYDGNKTIFWKNTVSGEETFWKAV